MLVLTRKVGETIRISDDIIVTVVEIRGDKIRIGIEAERSVSVHRGEIYDLIQQEKAMAEASDQCSTS